MTDYWVVTDKRTGRVICHCGEERDAIQMIMFDHNRIYRKQKFILDQVINISSSGIKELPGQQGLPEGKDVLPKEIEDFWILRGSNDVSLNLK